MGLKSWLENFDMSSRVQCLQIRAFVASFPCTSHQFKFGRRHYGKCEYQVEGTVLVSVRIFINKMNTSVKKMERMDHVQSCQLFLEY